MSTSSELPLNVVDTQLTIFQANLQRLAAIALNLAQEDENDWEYAGLAQAFLYEADVLREMQNAEPDARYAALYSVPKNLWHIRDEYPEEVVDKLDSRSSGELRTWVSK
jgi:hypothetical protein